MRSTFQDFSYHYLYLILLSILLASCIQENKPNKHTQIKVLDPTLQIELVLEDPEIMTPIGMTIDDKDALYIIESHTHSPLSDYTGPKYDRIKKGIDTNGDDTPDKWTIFADSLEDGMNLDYKADIGLFVTTKDAVYLLSDQNNDGISDEKKLLLHLYEPEKTYDHSAILGLAVGEDWLYVSRGNTGGNLWKVRGADGKEISGYGDGGSVMRCQLDGSNLQSVATGFWNPFDMKFLKNGRLFLTDNDPDSRGPNRLIEVVPGGDYGYQSIYGNSGNHPYLAWNGEVPGTLNYAAPLGEAPCALIDAAQTNFGFNESVLVNIWEENNIVKIDLEKQGSTLAGTAELLVQGDSLFHPVAFATNSKGDLFISDWVVRQYPNHGKGRIWKLSKKEGAVPPAPKEKVDRFQFQEVNVSNFEATLTSGDNFDKSIARFHAGKQMAAEDITPFLKSENTAVKLQALLTCLNHDIAIDKNILEALISNNNTAISQMAMIYIGQKRREDLKVALEKSLTQGKIKAELFEVFLSTIRQLQPDYISQYGNLKKSKELPRKLPENYIAAILENKNTDEAIRTIALTYLENKKEKIDLLVSTLKSAKTDKLKSAAIKALNGIKSAELANLLLTVAENSDNSEMVRAQAILELRMHAENFCTNIKDIATDNNSVIQYAKVKYLSKCMSDKTLVAQIDNDFNEQSKVETAASVWAFMNGKTEKPTTLKAWKESINDAGDPLIGKLVFETNLCASCHKIDGWGGAFGPDLTNIGKSKSKQLLINSILEPSKEIAPEWQGWYVVDKDGVRHEGRQIDVHLNNAELMNTDGTFTTYATPQSYGVSEKSLMPENLQNLMTGQEFNDLIAYLTTLK